MKYTFSYAFPHRHFINIEFTIKNVESDVLEIQLPAWRPGRYELGNFAKNIQKWAAFGEFGEELNFHKITKDKWLVKANENKTVTIRYNYYANELNAGSTFLDPTQLYVNPVNCCLYVPGRENEPCEVELAVPENYEVATGMKKVRKNSFAVRNFHELADSPFIASPSLKHDSFSCCNVLFHIWFQGSCYPDWAKIKADFIKYTEQQIAVFGEFPVNEYHYIYQILPFKAYHGVEHQNSTVCSLGPGHDLMKKELYDEFLGVSSHELFHAWNVKSIRPVEMQPYDYSKENYSRSGYMAEGITTYYGDLMLYRSGVFSAMEFLKLMAVQIQRHFDNFARFSYSVAESSFDTWLDGYVPGVPNRKLSIYSDGFLLAFMVDVLTLKYTIHAHRLDDIMKKMYLDYGKTGKGYAETDYKKTIELVSGQDFTEFFEKYVWGRNTYDELLMECLDYAGIKLDIIPSQNYHEAHYGIKTDANHKVFAVYPDSPADLSGLAPGDEILSIDNNAIPGNTPDWAGQFEGKAVILMLKKLMGNSEIRIVPSNNVHYKTYSLLAQNPDFLK